MSSHLFLEKVCVTFLWTMICFLQVNQHVFSGASTIVLSKYNSSKKDVSVVFDNVKIMESTWILHDLDIVMMNSNLRKSKFYLAKRSIPQNLGMVDIKGSVLEELKVFGGYSVYVEGGQICKIEAKSSDLNLNGLFPQIYVPWSSAEIHLANHSSLLMTGSSFENLWINAEESNVTIKNSIIQNVEMIDLNSNSLNGLNIENSALYITSNFMTSDKCALCLRGIENVTVYKSKFILDGISQHEKLWTICYGRYINVLDSQFETKEVPHLYITNGQYEFSTRGSIFREGNMTILSNQSNFIESAVEAGIVEINSSDVRHNELGKAIESRNSSNQICIWFSLFSVSCSVACMGGVWLYISFSKRRLARIVVPKRMRTYDAFLSHIHTNLDIALRVLEEMEEKYSLKLLIRQRDFYPGCNIVRLQNICYAAVNSNHAVIILSNEYLSSLWCQEELEICFMEHQRDPSFDISIILPVHYDCLTVQNTTVEQILSKKKYLEYDDPNFFQKLYENITSINRKMNQVKTCNSSDEEVKSYLCKLDLQGKSERTDASEARTKEVQLRRPGIAIALEDQSLKNQKNTGLR